MPVELRPVDKLRADLPTDPKPIASTVLLPRTDKLRTVLPCKPTVLVLIYLRYRLRISMLLHLWFNLARILLHDEHEHES